ncbi:hypothetical protein PROCOU_09816 [Listeria rocourtiae FSL F6-920]|nr:hypothetical protein PROCOU_09816 [Listeria rocourtiae FSL F6-920]
MSINVLLAIFIFYNSRNYYIAILLSFTQYILIMSIRIPISYLFYFTLDSPLFLLLVLLLENVIYYWFCVYLKKRKYQTILQNILSYPIKNKRSAAVFLSLFTIAFIGIQFFYLDIFTLAYIVSYVFFLLSTSIWLLITYIYTQKNMQKKILELKESRNRAAEDSLDNALNLQHDLKNMLFPLESYLKKK